MSEVYQYHFFRRKLEEHYAQMIVYEKEKMAQVILTTEISKTSSEVDEGTEAHAKHEAIHLLIHRLSWLGGCRYITDDDLGDECEAIVVRLEKVLK